MRCLWRARLTGDKRCTVGVRNAQEINGMRRDADAETPAYPQQPVVKGSATVSPQSWAKRSDDSGDPGPDHLDPGTAPI
jgi:hypothetical protein